MYFDKAHVKLSILIQERFSFSCSNYWVGLLEATILSQNVWWKKNNPSCVVLTIMLQMKFTKFLTQLEFWDINYPCSPFNFPFLPNPQK